MALSLQLPGSPSFMGVILAAGCVRQEEEGALGSWPGGLSREEVAPHKKGLLGRASQPPERPWKTVLVPLFHVINWESEAQRGRGIHPESFSRPMERLRLQPNVISSRLMSSYPQMPLWRSFLSFSS